MIISIVNQSSVADDEVQAAIRSVNRQIAEDVTPYWGLTATLRLDATGAGGTVTNVRGEALIRIRDEVNANHSILDNGFPEGVVFTRLREVTREHHPWMTWTVALSHEAIELLVDPNLNTLVRGPHPGAKRHVFHYREICDPVQANTYEVDGFPVSNFVTPAYYQVGKPSPNTNFLGIKLKPFGWLKGGSIGFWDPQKGARGGYVMWPPFTKGDVRAKVARYKDRMNASRILRYARPLRDGRKL